MKKKIYKVLGIVLTMAIIMSTCVCAVGTASADTTLEFAMANVLTNSGEFQLNPQTHRATATEALAIADYDKVTIADGWKAWFYAVKSDGKTLSDTTGCGNWATGTYAVSSLAGLPDATYFTITVAKNGNENFTVEEIPANIVTFTAAEKVNPTAALFALGNVNTGTGKFVLNTTVNTRATTKKLLNLADYDKVILKDGWKAWFYAYKSDGETLSDTSGNGTWATGTYSLSGLAGKDDATYFSITIATANNDALVIKDIPEDVMTLTEAVKLNPTAALFVNGTVDGGTGKVFSSDNRAYTKNALVLGDYEKVTIASGWKAYVQHYDIDGNWLSSGGKWVEETEFTTAEMPQAAAYFRFTLAKMGNENFVPADIPEDAAVFTEAPECAGHTYDNDCDALCNLCRRPRDVEGHVYDNDCDIDCNKCGEAREVADHVYDNACDADCNVCGATRTPADHVYDDDADVDCNVCGAARETETPCEHTYDNDCDASCNVCGETREVADHVYDNACDADCNVCGEAREAADHVYDNACDASCNVCGDTREVADHVYDNACDAECNVCGAGRQVAGHVYDDEFDAECNVCGHIRDAACDHTYDNACDADCNKCGEAREVADHVYDNACDADCNVCSEIREVADHVYDNACDANCNVCGATREVGDHVYDNACDADCNNCGATRTPADHVYDNACDADCNVCGETRVVGDHVYDNACDTNCNECGETRVVDHAYDNACDANCNECGATRVVGDHVYDNIFDADCNECGAIREVPDYCAHEYDNACDAECNLCGEIREVADHFYNTAYDKDCNICGEYREAASFGHIEIKNNKIYVDGRTSIRGMFMVGSDYYFADWGGNILTGKQYVKTSYCDLPGGKDYTFGADGKLLNGFVNDNSVTRYYVNGITVHKGIYKIDGDYYFANWGGVVTGGTFSTNYIYTGDDLKGGEYTFGADGKMLDGIVEVNGKLVLYKTGKTVAPGLYKVDGKYYAVTWGGVVRVDGKYYVKETFTDIAAGKTFECGADGAIIL